MSIVVSKYAESQEYGTVYAYEITMGDFSAKILSFGATWQSMTVPGRDGRKRDVLLGFDTLEGLLGGDYEGMVVGRYANRLSGAVTVNGKNMILKRTKTVSPACTAQRNFPLSTGRAGRWGRIRWN